jgi:hypothetical protein
LFHLENVAALDTHIEKRARHGIFDDLLVSIVNPGNAYFVAFVVLGYNIEILNPACTAFNAVTFHAVPPL